MFLVLNERNAVVDVSGKIIYARVDEALGEFMQCDSRVATHIWDIEHNTVYMKGDVTFTETDLELPEDFTVGKYFFVNDKFVVNEDYREPEPPFEEQFRTFMQAVQILAEDVELLNETITEMILAGE